MDESYFEADYIDFHYFNYTASASSSMTAFDVIDCAIRVIHLIAGLTYKIREETRLRTLAEETRYYKIKEK